MEEALNLSFDTLLMMMMMMMMIDYKVARIIIQHCINNNDTYT